MKKILIVLTATLFITLTAKGQNFLFFGEKSYPCTKTITLQSNSGANDLNVLFAKDGTTALIAVSIKTSSGVVFSGKLIIYLDDGTVITCKDSGKHDNVDATASALYYLPYEKLGKMKNSNINTVRYSLKIVSISDDEGMNFSASNKGTPTKTLITEFFDE